MIAGLLTGFAANPWVRSALRYGAIVLAVLLFLLSLRRSGERVGRLAERLETTGKANDVQRQMLEAAARRPRDRDERRLLRFQKQMAAYQLLIVDELGFVPLSKTGAELLFELISQRYERGATLITSNLPFNEWTETLGTERLTGALLDRITHHVNILEMNGDSYRLAQSRARKAG